MDKYIHLKLKGNAVVYVDLKHHDHCEKCGKMIHWGITRHEKKMPICKDKDGEYISHFADCPFAKEFRK